MGKFSEDYNQFLAEYKSFKDISCGIEIDENKINSKLFGFQNFIVRWALQRGKAAVFASTGLGKTIIQSEWARHVSLHTAGRVLIVAPLCVSHQTCREAKKFDIDIKYIRHPEDSDNPIVITNYEMLDVFDLSKFQGIVLDESSILKSTYGSTKQKIIEMSQHVPYRLSATATPSPNDYMELGNQSEFLGILSSSEMLATFFTHDGGETSKWRLKGHGVKKFWEWLSTWAIMIRTPSDLGSQFECEDEQFKLPPIQYHHHVVEQSNLADGRLFNTEAKTLSERREAQSNTINDRCLLASKIANSDKNSNWLIWCNRNKESELLTKYIDNANQVTGAMSQIQKEGVINGFTNGDDRVLVSKPTICGFGMNWQHCSNMVFVGLNDSFEQYYQAVRRCWRFGQKETVHVHIISADTEGAVVENIKRKEKQFDQMQFEMLKFMREIQHKKTMNSKREVASMSTGIEKNENFKLYLGDCVEVTNQFSSDSIDYTIFSPPFSSLYTYSNSERDMGNCKDDDEFMQHFSFLVAQLYRITKPGRLISFHCMNLPCTKQWNGFIGIRDFRGELIRLFQSKGFIFHSEVCIWKDPVTAMQRTKAIGLLYKQLKKDSALSRQGIPDYLVTVRKPGENQEPITKTPDGFPVSLWQNYASPVWMDINPSRTLQHRTARENDDERHICPLQLDVIERGIKLWSNPGDTVFTPFAGIGSEMYIALLLDRKAVGVELKKSYWELARKNCISATNFSTQESLLEMVL